MENGPFVDDFPIKTSIYKGFSMAMLNNQMVSPRWFQGVHLPEEPDFSAKLTLGRSFDAWVTSNVCASGRLVGYFMISHNHT